ncbi:MAG: dynamin family protein [Bryobacteraceae bacterium]
MDGAVQFNEAQRRRILANAEYADRLLADIEGILAGAEAGRLFPRHEPDFTPQQARLIRSSIALFRRQLGRFLEAARIGGDSRRARFGALHSFLTTLAFVRVAVEEISPEHLRGYGTLSAESETALRGLCNELEGLVTALEGELSRRAGADLESRLGRISDASLAGLLQTIGRIIAEEELPEFRQPLERLLEKLESPSYEVAVFGRVSSGKSSLLNYLLGAAVLPVGVTPVTAVPVRIRYGEQPALTVRFAGNRVERTGVDQIDLYASEEHNPGNCREVLQLLLELPSAILGDGVVFVDTPGLGSLATAGAAETLSYLPHCDLGLLLVSAVTPINEEDLATLHLLTRAGTPAMVLVSKADLIAAGDLERALHYTVSVLARETGEAPPVAAVSVAPGHRDLIERWKAEKLQALLERHRELAAQSLRRKALALRESVTAVLRARLQGTAKAPRPALERAEHSLRRAAAGLETARREVLDTADALRSQATQALALALESIQAQGPQHAIGALRTAALRVCDAAAKAIQRRLEECCSELSAAVETARSVLRPGSEAEAPGVNCEDLRGLPVPGGDGLPANLRLPAIAALPVVGRWLTAASLRRQAGRAVAKTMETYARSLESWALGRLQTLQQQFDAEAGVYRAEIARLFSAAEAEAGRRPRIEQLLAELERAGTGDAPGSVEEKPTPGA